MKTVEKILAMFPGQDCVKIKSEGFMDLVIERIGKGPNGLPAVSVCHYGEQNGDLMRDPEMCFEVSPLGWFAYYFRNDYAGLEQEVYVCNDEGKPTHVKPLLKKDLQAFSRIWSKNLREQGFIEAAKEKVKQN